MNGSSAENHSAGAAIAAMSATPRPACLPSQSTPGSGSCAPAAVAGPRIASAARNKSETSLTPGRFIARMMSCEATARPASGSSGATWSGPLAVLQPLPGLLDVLVEQVEAVGVAVRIGEVERLAARDAHAQVLLDVVHLERLELGERHQKRVRVRRFIRKPARRGAERAAAGAHSMFVDRRDALVQPHFLELP